MADADDSSVQAADAHLQPHEDPDSQDADMQDLHAESATPQQDGEQPPGAALRPPRAMFPPARIKSIIRLDRDVQAIPADTIYAITLATDVFLRLIAGEAFGNATQSGRRGITYRDIATVINDIEEFEFLTEIVPFTIPYSEAIEQKQKLDDMAANANVVSNWAEQIVADEE